MTQRKTKDHGPTRYGAVVCEVLAEIGAGGVEADVGFPGPLTQMLQAAEYALQAEDGSPAERAAVLRLAALALVYLERTRKEGA